MTSSKRGLLSAAALLMTVNSAFAFCSEPSLYESAPDAPGSFYKPDVPYCLSQYKWTSKHTCDQWEIDSYISDVNDYIRKLNDYADEARDFAEAATNFANDAIDYAECEAEDAKSQHE
ncbi:hypothetical protein [Roseibium aggregatum]|uniref:hypothetical protein n=1 Tax=Roseibium aggregatum TaxID=187304 RepID=UPI001E2B6E53|nr:hypothetical protein [Roseibium aggregatum]